MSRYLLEQLSLHPSMQFEDIIKICYQASYGAEHLLKDLDSAKKYLFSEWDSIAKEDKPLYEEISPCYARLNLSACKYHNYNKEKVFLIFKDSVIPSTFKPQVFHTQMDEYLLSLEKVFTKERLEEFNLFLHQYYQNGVRPIRHSAIYREKENPHYRVVLTKKIQEL
ncbi:MAG: hypothetical protein K5762_05785 [Bacilli bacterium]|nr:hypothetical protein [Bacilli bacterium]